MAIDPGLAQAIAGGPETYAAYKAAQAPAPIPVTPAKDPAPVIVPSYSGYSPEYYQQSGSAIQTAYAQAPTSIQQIASTPAPPPVSVVATPVYQPSQAELQAQQMAISSQQTMIQAKAIAAQEEERITEEQVQKLDDDQKAQIALAFGAKPSTPTVLSQTQKVQIAGAFGATATPESVKVNLPVTPVVGPSRDYDYKTDIAAQGAKRLAEEERARISAIPKIMEVPRAPEFKEPSVPGKMTESQLLEMAKATEEIYRVAPQLAEAQEEAKATFGDVWRKTPIQVDIEGKAYDIGAMPGQYEQPTLSFGSPTSMLGGRVPVPPQIVPSVLSDRKFIVGAPPTPETIRAMAQKPEIQTFKAPTVQELTGVKPTTPTIKPFDWGVGITQADLEAAGIIEPISFSEELPSEWITEAERHGLSVPKYLEREEKIKDLDIAPGTIVTQQDLDDRASAMRSFGAEVTDVQTLDLKLYSDQELAAELEGYMSSGLSDPWQMDRIAELNEEVQKRESGFRDMPEHMQTDTVWEQSKGVSRIAPNKELAVELQTVASTIIEEDPALLDDPYAVNIDGKTYNVGKQIWVKDTPEYDQETGEYIGGSGVMVHVEPPDLKYNEETETWEPFVGEFTKEDLLANYEALKDVDLKSTVIVDFQGESVILDQLDPNMTKEKALKYVKENYPALMASYDSPEALSEAISDAALEKAIDTGEVPMGTTKLQYANKKFNDMVADQKERTLVNSATVFDEEFNIFATDNTQIVTDGEFVIRASQIPPGQEGNWYIETDAVAINNYLDWENGFKSRGSIPIQGGELTKDEFIQMSVKEAETKVFYGEIPGFEFIAGSELKEGEVRDPYTGGIVNEAEMLANYVSDDPNAPGMDPDDVKMLFASGGTVGISKFTNKVVDYFEDLTSKQDAMEVALRPFIQVDPDTGKELGYDVQGAIDFGRTTVKEVIESKMFPSSVTDNLVANSMYEQFSFAVPIESTEMPKHRMRDLVEGGGIAFSNQAGGVHGGADVKRAFQELIEEHIGYEGKDYEEIAAGVKEIVYAGREVWGGEDVWTIKDKNKIADIMTHQVIAINAINNRDKDQLTKMRDDGDITYKQWEAAMAFIRDDVYVRPETTSIDKFVDNFLSEEGMKTVEIIAKGSDEMQEQIHYGAEWVKENIPKEAVMAAMPGGILIVGAEQFIPGIGRVTSGLYKGSIDVVGGALGAPVIAGEAISLGGAGVGQTFVAPFKGWDSTTAEESFRMSGSASWGLVEGPIQFFTGGDGQRSIFGRTIGAYEQGGLGAATEQVFTEAPMIAAMVFGGFALGKGMFAKGKVVATETIPKWRRVNTISKTSEQINHLNKIIENSNRQIDALKDATKTLEEALGELPPELVPKIGEGLKTLKPYEIRQNLMKQAESRAAEATYRLAEESVKYNKAVADLANLETKIKIRQSPKPPTKAIEELYLDNKVSATDFLEMMKEKGSTELKITAEGKSVVKIRRGPLQGKEVSVEVLEALKKVMDSEKALDAILETSKQKKIAELKDAGRTDAQINKIIKDSPSEVRLTYDNAGNPIVEIFDGATKRNFRFGEMDLAASEAAGKPVSALDVFRETYGKEATKAFIDLQRANNFLDYAMKPEGPSASYLAAETELLDVLKLIDEDITVGFKVDPATGKMVAYVKLPDQYGATGRIVGKTYEGMSQIREAFGAEGELGKMLADKQKGVSLVEDISIRATEELPARVPAGETVIGRFYEYTKAGETEFAGKARPPGMEAPGKGLTAAEIEAQSRARSMMGEGPAKETFYDPRYAHIEGAGEGVSVARAGQTGVEIPTARPVVRIAGEPTSVVQSLFFGEAKIPGITRQVPIGPKTPTSPFAWKSPKTWAPAIKRKVTPSKLKWKGTGVVKETIRTAKAPEIGGAFQLTERGILPTGQFISTEPTVVSFRDPKTGKMVRETVTPDRGPLQFPVGKGTGGVLTPPVSWRGLFRKPVEPRGRGVMDPIIERLIEKLDTEGVPPDSPLGKQLKAWKEELARGKPVRVVDEPVTAEQIRNIAREELRENLGKEPTSDQLTNYIDANRGRLVEDQMVRMAAEEPGTLIKFEPVEGKGIITWKETSSDIMNAILDSKKARQELNPATGKWVDVPAEPITWLDLQRAQTINQTKFNPKTGMWETTIYDATGKNVLRRLEPTENPPSRPGRVADDIVTISEYDPTTGTYKTRIEVRDLPEDWGLPRKGESVPRPKTPPDKGTPGVARDVREAQIKQKVKEEGVYKLTQEEHQIYKDSLLRDELPANFKKMYRELKEAVTRDATYDELTTLRSKYIEAWTEYAKSVEGRTPEANVALKYLDGEFETAISRRAKVEPDAGLVELTDAEIRGTIEGAPETRPTAPKTFEEYPSDHPMYELGKRMEEYKVLEDSGIDVPFAEVRKTYNDFTKRMVDEGYWSQEKADSFLKQLRESEGFDVAAEFMEMERQFAPEVRMLDDIYVDLPPEARSTVLDMPTAEFVSEGVMRVGDQTFRNFGRYNKDLFERLQQEFGPENVRLDPRGNIWVREKGGEWWRRDFDEGPPEYEPLDPTGRLAPRFVNEGPVDVTVTRIEPIPPIYTERLTTIPQPKNILTDITGIEPRAPRLITETPRVTEIMRPKALLEEPRVGVEPVMTEPRVRPSEIVRPTTEYTLPPARILPEVSTRKPVGVIPGGISPTIVPESPTYFIEQPTGPYQRPPFVIPVTPEQPTIDVPLEVVPVTPPIEYDLPSYKRPMFPVHRPYGEFAAPEDITYPVYHPSEGWDPGWFPTEDISTDPIVVPGEEVEDVVYQPGETEIITDLYPWITPPTPIPPREPVRAGRGLLLPPPFPLPSPLRPGFGTGRGRSRTGMAAALLGRQTAIYLPGITVGDVYGSPLLKKEEIARTHAVKYRGAGTSPVKGRSKVVKGAKIIR